MADISKLKILYLYEEVMGYTLATIQALMKRDVEMHIIHWDHKKITPFKLPTIDGVNFYSRSKLDLKSMKNLVEKINPDITVVSGWNDYIYLRICKNLRRKNSLVILAMDSCWKGGIKQRIAKFLGWVKWFNRYFTHAWVPGFGQFEYAKILGFKSKKIILDLYSADLDLFNQGFVAYKSNKVKKYPHRFMYVGRFECVKGVETLLNAWEIIGPVRRDWDLHLIGHGSVNMRQQQLPGIVVSDFMQPPSLLKETAKSGCLILPSFNEPWGVVVHEFAAAGLPVILSDSVGSGNSFLIPGKNGFLFKSGSSFDLAKKMLSFIEMPDDQLAEMADASHILAQRITPETSSGNLLSVIYK